MALRVAIVGGGVRGRQWAHFVRQSGVARLAGLVEIDPATRERLGRDPAFAGVPIAGALDEIASLDAVVVATGTGQHTAPAAQALARSLSVLVEKPFTLDLREAVDLVHTAEARGAALLVAQNYRYLRVHRAVRRLVQDDVLGRLSTVACHYWRASHAVDPSIAALEAAALWETGIHHLDALRYALDRRVVGVMADVTSAPWSAGLRGSDTKVLLRFEDGISGVYSVSWAAPGHEFFEAGQQFYERLTGERGTLHVLQRWLVLCLSGRWPRLVRRGSRPEPEERTLLRELAAAHAGASAACSGRDNLQTMAVVAACVESWRSRRWVDPQQLLHEAGA